MWIWGDGEDGQVSATTSKFFSPIKLPQFGPGKAGGKAAKVDCGFCTTGVINESGEIWVWGCVQGQDGRKPDKVRVVVVVMSCF